MEPPPGPLTFFGSVRAGQALNQSRALTVEPASSSRASQGSLRGFFVVEGPVDGLFRYFGGHSLLAQLLGQTKASSRPEADPAAHEGQREGMVVDEPLFLEEAEAPLNERVRKALGTEAAPKLLLGSRSVREKMKGGLANTPLGIVFLQLREILRGYVVSDVDARALHDIERELYGRYGFCKLGVLQMHEDLVLLARRGLDAEDSH